MYQPVNSKTTDQDQRDCVSEEQSLAEQKQSPDKSDSFLNDGTDSTARRRTELSLALRITMVSSLLSIAAAVSFITWLWWASRDSLLWRSWVLIENRTQLSITIAALVIRTAVGLLASIATPMIVSVALERNGVSLQSIAQLSITRYASSGPLSLGPFVLKDPILGIRTRSIMILLIFTTLPAQFTSSLLMLDLEGREIVSLPRIIPTYGIPELKLRPQDWQRSPILAHTFAEYLKPTKFVDGVDDTGVTIRALLPVTVQKTREKLRDFQGMARVINSRVTCIRPDILNLRECRDPDTNSSNICVRARLDESILTGIGFEVGRYDDDDYTFDIFCPLRSSSPEPGLQEQPMWGLCKQPFLSYPYASFLSLDTGTNYGDWMILWSPSLGLLYERLNWQDSPYNVTYSGPWARPWLEPETSGSTEADSELFKMTACVLHQSGKQHQYLKIHVSTSSSSSQTEQLYDWENGSYSFNPGTVLGQLGISSISNIQGESVRGLRIHPQSLEASVPESPHKFEMEPYIYGVSSGSDELPQSNVVFCLECSNLDSYTIADSVFTKIMHEALRYSPSPARMLQALFFTLSRLHYYENMNKDPFKTGTARITALETAIFPSHFRGYCAVMAILFVFLATFTLTVVLFRETRFSLPENAWHTIAQVSESPELRDVLREAKKASDDDVRHFINGTKPPVSFLNKADYAYDRMEIYWDTLLSMFKSEPGYSGQPRFVVRDGVFVRASGETDGKSGVKDLRHRPGEKNQSSETL